MTAHLRKRSLFVLPLIFAAITSAHAQDTPTRYRPLQLSAFGEAAIVNTGLPKASNLAISGGADLQFRSRPFYALAAEYRGTYALTTGKIASENSNLGGLRVSVPFRRIVLYADALAGRGELTYYGVGYQVPGTPIFYRKSSAHVFGGGGGVELRISPSFSFKLDAQIERYATPVVASGSIMTTVLGAGLVYRVHFPARQKRHH